MYQLLSQQMSCKRYAYLILSTNYTASLDGRIREGGKKITEAKVKYDFAVSEFQSLLGGEDRNFR